MESWHDSAVFISTQSRHDYTITLIITHTHTHSFYHQVIVLLSIRSLSLSLSKYDSVSLHSGSAMPAHTGVGSESNAAAQCLNQILQLNFIPSVRVVFRAQTLNKEPCSLQAAGWERAGFALQTANGIFRQRQEPDRTQGSVLGKKTSFFFFKCMFYAWAPWIWRRWRSWSWT